MKKHREEDRDFIKFKDLVWRKHHVIPEAEQALFERPDGTRISILRVQDQNVKRFSGGAKGLGHGRLLTAGSTYEMMSNRSQRIDGVSGWVTEKAIYKHMKYVQKNPLSEAHRKARGL
jgi:hypothetical protein